MIRHIGLGGRGLTGVDTNEVDNYFNFILFLMTDRLINRVSEFTWLWVMH
jgi:hypothetical protein